VLFPNQINGIKLDRILRRLGYNAVIVPTPRNLSKSCGISLMINEEDVDSVKEVINNNNIEIIDIVSRSKDE
jgi:hypothetical protein